MFSIYHPRRIGCSVEISNGKAQYIEQLRAHTVFIGQINLRNTICAGLFFMLLPRFFGSWRRLFTHSSTTDRWRWEKELTIPQTRLPGLLYIPGTQRSRNVTNDQTLRRTNVFMLFLVVLRLGIKLNRTKNPD